MTNEREQGQEQDQVQDQDQEREQEEEQEQESSAPETGSGDDTTVSITRRIRAGKEQEFEQLFAELGDALATYPGFRTIRLVRPVRGSRDYRAILTFASEEDQHRWKSSAERLALLARFDEVSENESFVANISGTSQTGKLALALSPLDSYVRTTVSGIGLLLLGTILAIICANSPLADLYHAFWETKFTIGTERFGISESLRHWVNDGLMALFFFIVGLEIKREVLVGEMRSPRLAALPISAAVGGVVVPALLFLLINRGEAGAGGWGVPIATDTAFSLGVMTLFATRVRPLLLVFLTAFAIVDDILAVFVIAIFYTDQISWTWIGVTVVLIGLLAAANAAGFHRWPVYAFLGLAVWVAVFESGVHATFAGVLVAMTVPARSWINPSEFLVRAKKSIEDFEAACFLAPNILTNEPQQRATQELERLCEDVETPMTHLQHRLNPWVAYGILPIFAFANAGIPLVEGLGEALTSHVAWGVIVGLVIGKPIGILLFSWLAVRVGLAIRPPSITWHNIAAVGMLGGIGFTISLFVAELAFPAGPTADAARVGILFGSLFAGIAGYFALRATLPPPRPDET